MPHFTHLAFHVSDLDACADFYVRFCEMQVTHRRDGVVWLAEPGREEELIFVLVEGGRPTAQPGDDYSHVGFALESRAAVDDIASRARAEDRLVWAPREEPWPVGYYCGVRDPDGNMVEFSFGQPLGPGARDRS